MTGNYGLFIAGHGCLAGTLMFCVVSNFIIFFIVDLTHIDRWINR